MSRKPNSSPEIDKAEKQFDHFEKQIKDLTLDRMNSVPKEEVEPQTKLSQSEIEKSKEIYLKPQRAIASKEKFNEKFREDYNYSKEYVHFIAENKEVIGENIEMWTKPFPGMPAEFWNIPTNKPIWAPRYVPEQITKAKYHRLRTENNRYTAQDQNGEYYGTLVVDNIIQRLDAIPARSERKSLFMGKEDFAFSSKKEAA